ncbi:MAG: RusA family crossover junction endodeoxyribonuclease [Dialister invisus]|uniref:RusA family crossover junction endodeoxyribonuclease n=1 Tax=Dialister invisus TaxID=218538 RepID=UPI0039A0D647
MRLLIPGRLPCMNDLIAANRLNKYAGAGVKKKTQRQIILILQPQVQVQGKRFTEKVNIRIEYYEKDMRRDEDNVMSAAKFILDALQDMELILNDSQKYVHLTQEVFTDRKNPRIEITIKGG